MRYAKILLILLFPFLSMANEESTESKAYENKINYCRDLSFREIDKIDDPYFNSLDDRNKGLLIGVLYFKSMDNCYLYEEMQHFKAVIYSGDEERLKSLKIISKPLNLNDLDINEIKRLSELEMFSSPFDRWKLRDKLGL